MDLTASLNVERYFEGGTAPSPWTLNVSDEGGARPVEGSSTTSPAGRVTVRGVDVAAQEDGRRVTWSGPGRVTIDGPAADLSRQQTGAFALTVGWRIDALGQGPVQLGLGGVALDVTDRVRAGRAPATLRVPIRCFTARGADVTAVGNAFSLAASAGTDITLIKVGLEPVGEPLTCPDE